MDKELFKSGMSIVSYVQGMNYATPPMPELNKIRNYKLPVEDQVYSRHEEYLQWEWNVEEPKKKGDPEQWFVNPAKGQMQWYEQEIQRCLEGEWILINGIPTYFNKWAYFFHQWFILQEGFSPDYRDTSLEFFRFFELCDDDFTLGCIGIKGRRLGLSSMVAAIILWVSLFENNNLMGIVSKSADDAEEMYIMAKNALVNLHPALIPSVRLLGKDETHIATPITKISKNNKLTSLKSGLNNRFNWLAPKETAYDGRALRICAIDEAAKWETVNVKIMFEKVSETLVVGSSVIGKVIMISTINAGEKGGNNFKAIWDSSDPKKVDYMRQTSSRLKRFFIEGYRGVEGFVDKYGNSVVETPTPEQTAFMRLVRNKKTKKLSCQDPTIGAKQFRMNRRKALENDAEGLQEEIRKYPFNVKEAFKGANNKCHFKIRDINAQVDIVEAKLAEANLYRKGWFHLDSNKKPYFKDADDGLWLILELLKPQDANKAVMTWDGLSPDNTNYGAAGFDPYANTEETTEKGSLACVMIHKRYNALDVINSDLPVAMFHGKMDIKEDLFDQIFWGLRYYGVKLLAERTPTDWYDYAKKYNLLCYCIQTDLKTKGIKRFGIAPQDKQAREQHLTEMKEYSLNNMGKIWFLVLLKDMIGFDAKERTIYDVCMAWGYALMALKEGVRTIVDNDEDEEQNFATYRLDEVA